MTRDARSPAARPTTATSRPPIPARRGMRFATHAVYVAVICVLSLALWVQVKVARLQADAPLEASYNPRDAETYRATKVGFKSGFHMGYYIGTGKQSTDEEEEKAFETAKEILAKAYGKK